jgi:hypothetical protein
MPAIQPPSYYRSGLHGASASGRAFTGDRPEWGPTALGPAFAGPWEPPTKPEAGCFPAGCSSAGSVASRPSRPAPLPTCRAGPPCDCRRSLPGAESGSRKK